jgi:hypothetical protein
MSKDTMIIGKAAVLIAVTIMLISMGWSAYENNSIRRPLQELCESKEEFSDIIAEVRYGGYLDTGTLIFNLIKISEPNKMTPFLFFMEYAKKLNTQKFNEVIIQYKGKTKYRLSGENFTRLGTMAQLKTPEQAAIEFPVSLRKPDGLPAFEQPYGDEQWVEQKQIKNFRDFLVEWYLAQWMEDEKGGKPKDLKIEVTKSPTETPQETESPFSETPENPVIIEITPAPSPGGSVTPIEATPTPSGEPSAAPDAVPGEATPSPSQKTPPGIEPEVIRN